MDQVRRGTGIAVASSIEVKDVGKGRSLDEEDDDRREDTDVLDGVRKSDSRRTEVRELRLGGITTGLVLSSPYRLIQLSD